MCAERSFEQHAAGSRAEAVLTWLGGGHWRELGERHERSTTAVAGVVVLVGAALAWLVATLAVAGSTDWPVWAILPLTLLFGLLVGAVTRAVASGPARGWSIVGRGAVAVLVGAVVGELAAIVLFSGSIDRRIDAQAARAADSTPAVAQASADVGRLGRARNALDDAVDQARIHQDQALVVARCEYNPTPGCPQTRITGVPGAGPETRTANQLLADTQREFDNAVAARDRQAPGLDSEIAGAEQTLVAARQAAIANTDRGLGARWVAMHDHTLASAGALVLWAITIAFFVLLSLLPLILNWLRGETTHDRGAASRAQRDRAEVDADTAIAVKRAEVRAAVENMWADQQLASARLAVEAQNEIDRELHRRRVAETLDAPVQAALQRAPEPVGEENLPARIESGPSLLPNVTKAAARWIRPFVPPIVAKAIDTSTQPLRTARQVFEEVEEITFAFKRTHRVTVDSEETAESTQQIASVATEAEDVPRRVESSRAPERASLTARERRPELADWDRPGEVRGSASPRELPPAE
jgi:Domain of unknown function (DUF4407)